MKALILAAGLGSRLKEQTEDKPKCLVPVNGKPILQYQLEALLANNITDVIIVTGYQSEKISEFIDNYHLASSFNFTFVNNPLYDQSNSSYSGWLAMKEIINQDYIHINCDIIFSAELLRKLITNHCENVVVIDDNIALGPSMDQVVIDNQSRMVDGNKITATCPMLSEANGKAVGLAKFSAKTVSWFNEWISKHVNSGDKNKNFYGAIWAAVHYNESDCIFHGMKAENDLLCEVNTLEDLRKAGELLSRYNRKAIVLDFDGVVIDSEKIRYSTYEKLFREEFNVIISPFDKSIIGRKQEVNLQFFLDQHDLKADLQHLVNIRTGLLKDTFSDEENIIPVKGLSSFIKKIKDEGYLLAIGSSSSRVHIISVLEKLNLLEHFDQIVAADNVNKGKPDPEVYNLVAKKLNINPCNCIVFEDSLHGLAAAKSADMKCIGITTTFNKEEMNHADYIVNNFEELDVLTLNQLF